MSGILAVERAEQSLRSCPLSRRSLKVGSGEICMLAFPLLSLSWHWGNGCKGGTEQDRRKAFQGDCVMLNTSNSPRNPHLRLQVEGWD